MADRRFFEHAGPQRLEDIAQRVHARLVLAKNGSGILQARDVAPLETATGEDISFLDNVKYIASFAASNAGACFVRERYADRAPTHMTLLVTEEPYTAYALTAQLFYPAPRLNAEISPHAHVANSAKIGKGTRIDAGVVIGENVEIGEHCHIGAVSTITHSIIGHHVVIHRGVHIGQDGFGWAPGKGGLTKVPQLGRVMIGDHVEIGSGTCIDRGSGPDTVIGSHSKIDNLVQIGHNVHIGQHVVIAAQAGLAGSTKVGNGVMIGGQAGISGHVTIGDGAKLAAQAGIMTDVPAGATYGGSPAVPARDWHKRTVAVAKLVNKASEG
ncbi:MAG: UDP-3-O-(3-hydroxymyristoyl)glucosamine N-acyltransferase [Alphaproteobacteria bacterium]